MKWSFGRICKKKRVTDHDFPPPFMCGEGGFVFRHGVLNNSIFRHDKNNLKALTVSQSIEVLKGLEALKDKHNALVYCVIKRSKYSVS